MNQGLGYLFMMWGPVVFGYIGPCAFGNMSNIRPG